ncbi:hypothetical protein PVAND_004468 [Polypedilum vanderplanki]|uniref:Organic solute transporter alpha-like protein n=1 Tax=Polypedilum vanderplanki TaxID=319348 RepID=A0A9J6BXN4_POLVA|nr:hypothetical protein PVAND_004468 [Polypedilum vanderplanki]
MENITNDSIDCIDGIPSADEFFASLNFLYKWILVIPTGFFLMTVTIYILNLYTVIKYGKRETKSNVLILLTLYPTVALVSLISIFMPKTYFFCDFIAHTFFVISSYQLYRYCINCIEGESKFIAISKNESFTLKTPPVCCCCLCFSTSMITKKKFLWIRLLVLQMAVVHVIIFSILNLINIENPPIVDYLMLYFLPVIATSILLAVWGFNVIIRMLVPYYSNLNLLKKFLAFQLVLVSCKFQPVLLNLILRNYIETCDGAITVVVKIRTITQIFIQFEMIILSDSKF